MEDVIDLASYRIDRPGRPDRQWLVDDCRAKLHRNGLVNLPDLLHHEASAAAIDELAPVIDRHAFIHNPRTLNCSTAGTPHTLCRRCARRSRS